MKCNERAKKPLWHNSKYYPGTTEKNQENPVKMEGLWAGIWSQDLPNMKQDYEPNPNIH
jgi:hypothetical protein